MKEAIHKPQESRVLQPKPGKNQPPLEQILATYYKPLQRTPAVIQRGGGDIESGESIEPYGAPSLDPTLYIAPNIKGLHESIIRNPRTGENAPTDRTQLDGMLLNHYMVVRNGTQYQLPIRAALNPYSNMRHKRGLRVEPFGGNQGWNDYQNNIKTELDYAALKVSRNRTLGHEYFEEAGEPLSASVVPAEGADSYTTINDAHVSKSVYFKSKGEWKAQGTVSIVDSEKVLTSKANPNLENPKSDLAKREMAGTIVIETNDIEGKLEDIEEAIKKRIMEAQGEFINDSPTEDFGTGSEILLMLVKLMAQQVLERNEEENEDEDIGGNVKELVEEVIDEEKAKGVIDEEKVKKKVKEKASSSIVRNPFFWGIIVFLIGALLYSFIDKRGRK